MAPTIHRPLKFLSTFNHHLTQILDEHSYKFHFLTLEELKDTLNQQDLISLIHRNAEEVVNKISDGTIESFPKEVHYLLLHCIESPSFYKDYPSIERVNLLSVLDLIYYVADKLKQKNREYILETLTSNIIIYLTTITGKVVSLDIRGRGREREREREQRSVESVESVQHPTLASIFLSKIQDEYKDEKEDTNVNNISNVSNVTDEESEKDESGINIKQNMENTKNEEHTGISADITTSVSVTLSPEELSSIPKPVGPESKNHPRKCSTSRFADAYQNDKFSLNRDLIHIQPRKKLKYIKTSDLYLEYVRYCRENGENVAKYNSFSKNSIIKLYFPEINNVNSNGKNIRCRMIRNLQSQNEVCGVQVGTTKQ
jgi:hypothetical protein